MSHSIQTFLYIALTLVITVFAIIGILFVFDIGSTEEYRDAMVKALSLIGIITAAFVLVTLLNNGRKSR